jgi:indole-3-glycerol phosphate synthase
MSDVLQRICADKRAAVAKAKTSRPLGVVEFRAARAPAPRGFIAALERALAAKRYGLIAEIKRASPSRGVIRADFDPPSLAQAYERGGATCLSVLTDQPYFQGLPVHLELARRAVPLPILRKDFMLDPYQVAEARAMGADCILLIMAALSHAQAGELEDAALGYGMDVLIEVHDRAELDRALRLSSPLIGINNRNLKTLDVSLEMTEQLAALLPPGRIAVSESGLNDPADLARMARAGARCFLVGESLMKQADVEAATRALLAGTAARASA